MLSPLCPKQPSASFYKDKCLLSKVYPDENYLQSGRAATVLWLKPLTLKWSRFLSLLNECVVKSDSSKSDSVSVYSDKCIAGVFKQTSPRWPVSGLKQWMGEEGTNRWGHLYFTEMCSHSGTSNPLSVNLWMCQLPTWGRGTAVEAISVETRTTLTGKGALCVGAGGLSVASILLLTLIHVWTNRKNRSSSHSGSCHFK